MSDSPSKVGSKGTQRPVGIDLDQYERLRDNAEKNYRSIAGEVRLALDLYLNTLVKVGE